MTKFRDQHHQRLLSRWWPADVVQAGEREPSEALWGADAPGVGAARMAHPLRVFQATIL